MRTWLFAVLLGACGGSSKPAEAPSVAAPPSCTTSAWKLVELVTARQDPAPPDEAVNELISLIRNRCEADGWTVAAQRCFGAMKTAADADRCGTLLTEAQQAALVRDQRERYGGE